MGCSAFAPCVSTAQVKAEESNILALGDMLANYVDLGETKKFEFSLTFLCLSLSYHTYLLYCSYKVLVRTLRLTYSTNTMLENLSPPILIKYLYAYKSVMQLIPSGIVVIAPARQSEH